MQRRTFAAGVLLLLAILAVVPPAVAGGGGVLLDASTLVLVGDGEVGTGPMWVAVNVTETQGQSAVANLSIVLKTTAGQLLIDQLQSIPLGANNSTALNISLGNVPVGRHQLNLSLNGEVATPPGNGSDLVNYLQVVVWRRAPADVRIAAAATWALTVLDGGTETPTGNASLRDGDRGTLALEVSNTGEEVWNGTLNVSLVTEAWQVQTEHSVDLANGSTSTITVVVPRVSEGELNVTATLLGLADATPADDTRSRLLSVAPPPLARPVLTSTPSESDPELSAEVTVNWTAENLGEARLIGEVVCRFGGVEVSRSALDLMPGVSGSGEHVETARPGQLSCVVETTQRLHPDSLPEATINWTMAAPSLAPATTQVLVLRGGAVHHVGDAVEASVLVHNSGDAIGSARLQLSSGGVDVQGSIVVIGAGNSAELVASITLEHAGVADIDWGVLSQDALVQPDLSGRVSVDVAASQGMVLELEAAAWDAEHGVNVTVRLTLDVGPTRRGSLVLSAADDGSLTERHRQVLELRPGRRTVAVELGSWQAGDVLRASFEPDGWRPTLAASDSMSLTAPDIEPVVSIEDVSPEAPLPGATATITWRVANDGTDALPPGVLLLVDARDGRRLANATTPRLAGGADTKDTMSIRDWPAGSVALKLTWSAPGVTSAETERPVLSGSASVVSQVPWAPLLIAVGAALVLFFGARLVRGGQRVSRAPPAEDGRRQVHCPECDTTLLVPVDHDGKVRCRACTHVFQISPETDHEATERPAAKASGGELAVVRSADDELDCPSCGQRLRVPVDRRPAKARCPACTTIFRAEAA